jgi:hypothetical protein
MTKKYLIGEEVVSEYGFTITARTSADLPVHDRTGDHTSYEVEVVPGPEFMGESFVWTFSGELERGVAIAALRELADQLEKSKG